ncbi:MAG: SIMPL domain-containing protein, partial [Treponema sp.]|nr:SIMPL domain-containing protein [Treponema sp.]
FEVSNRITLTLKDALKAGEIIDAAVKHGPNSLSSLEYKATPSLDSTKQARILAVKNAESVANTMATAAGAKLGEVITINELWSSGVQRYSALEEAKADGFTSSALSSPGSSAITVQIQATYALEQ